MKVKKKTLTLTQQMLFQDCFDSNDLLILPPLKKTDSVFEKLSIFCPAELFKQKTLIAGEAAQAQVAASGYIVPYSPLKPFQKNLSSLLKKAEKYSILPLTLLVAFCLCSYDPNSLTFFKYTGVLHYFGFLVLMAAILLAVVLAVRETNYSLSFTADGIVIVWVAFGESHRTKPIPWDSIKYVSHRVEQVGKQKRDRIEFGINPLHPAAKHVSFLKDHNISVGIFRQQGDTPVLSLNLEAIPDAKNKQDLLAVLSGYLPAELVDASVPELLNPTDPGSYTALWMETLGNNSNLRRFEGHLNNGQQLKNGSFEIAEFLGAGGQASVYSAQKLKENDAETKAAGLEAKEGMVVLKEFILPSHAGAELSQRSLEHVQKEMDLMKKLEHPNIVKYYDIFVEDHRCYLVLEHVNGKSLRTIVDESGPLPEHEVARLAVQMAQILDYLHRQAPPIVHRDFTPENLLLGQDGTLKLLDFNVAQELEEGATHTIVGKHSYLPPEQFRGKACPQSDIYAMGACLFFLLTGDEPEPISCSHPMATDQLISIEMDAIVARATELELLDRFQNAAELLNELGKLSPPDSAK